MNHLLTTTIHPFFFAHLLHLSILFSNQQITNSVFNSKPLFKDKTLAILITLAIMLQLFPNKSEAYEIVVEQGLRFEHGIAKTNQHLKTEPDSHNAAVFHIFKGRKGQQVSVYIVEKTIELKHRLNHRAPGIKVGPFRIEQQSKGRGRSHHFTFDKRGTIRNIKIGAIAKISHKNIGGHYRGYATIRVIPK